MKKEQKKNVLWAIVVVTALAEAVCGRKFMKRIGKRLKALDKMAEVEGWVGVYNLINHEKRLSTGNSALSHSPLVMAESRLIVEKILGKYTDDHDALFERIKSIIERKFQKIDAMQGYRRDKI